MKFLLPLLMLLLPSVAEAHGYLREIREGEVVTLRPDRAYLLFRTIKQRGVTPYSPILLRVPSEQDLSRYEEARRRSFEQEQPRLMRRYQEQLARAHGGADEAAVAPSLINYNFVYDDVANVDEINVHRPFVRGDTESVFLAKADPGDYVLYGIRWGVNTGVLQTCMCLGTVGFQATAGTITDLGYFYSDTVGRGSILPELRDETNVTNGVDSEVALAGATVRPAQGDATIPASLRTLSIHSASYRAIGRFVEPRAMSINRLAPVPGVLSYEGGRPTDVTTGRQVPDVN